MLSWYASKNVSTKVIVLHLAWKRLNHVEAHGLFSAGEACTGLIEVGGLRNVLVGNPMKLLCGIVGIEKGHGAFAKTLRREFVYAVWYVCKGLVNIELARRSLGTLILGIAA